MARSIYIDDLSDQPPQFECTACLTTILEKTDAKRHQELGCIICMHCYNHFLENIRASANGDGFSLNKLGHQKKCRLCCGDRYLIACLRCRRAFCHSCVQRYDSDANVLNVYRSSPDRVAECKWVCFVCDPGKQVQFRGNATRQHSDENDNLQEINIDGVSISVAMVQHSGDLIELDSSETEIDDDYLEASKQTTTSGTTNNGKKTDEISYRNHDWSIVGHYIRESKVEFRITWDGFVDFETLDDVDFVMTDYEKVKSYLKAVRIKDCYTFNDIIKTAPQLANVFKVSVTTVNSGQPQQASNLNQANTRSKPMIEKINIQQVQSSGVPVEKTSDLDLSTRKRPPSPSQTDSPAKRKSKGDLIPSSTSDVSLPKPQNKSGEKIPINNPSCRDSVPSRNQVTNQHAQKSSSKAESITTKSQNKPATVPVDKTPLNKPAPIANTSQVSEACDFSHAPNILSETDNRRARASLSVSSETKNQTKGPPINGTSAPIKSKQSPVKRISETNVLATTCTTDRTVAPASSTLTEKTPTNQVLQSSTISRSSVDDNIISKVCEVPQARQIASFTTDGQVNVKSSKQPVIERSHSNTQAATSKRSADNLPQSSTRPEVKNLSETSIPKPSTQSTAIKPSTKTSDNIKHQVDSKKRDTNQSTASQTPEQKSQKQAGQKSPERQVSRANLSSGSNSEKSNNNKKSGTTNDRANQGPPSEVTLADIMPIDRVATDYKIPRVNPTTSKPASNNSNQKPPVKFVVPQEHARDQSSENKNKESSAGVSSRQSGEEKPVRRHDQESSSSESRGLNIRRVDSTTESSYKKPADRSVTTSFTKSSERSRADRRESGHSRKRSSSSNSSPNSHTSSSASRSRIRGRSDEEAISTSRRFGVRSPTRAYDDRSPRFRRDSSVDGGEPSNSRPTIFDRLERRAVGRSSRSPVETSQSDRPERVVRKIYGAKPSPYSSDPRYVQPASHAKALVPMVVRKLLSRIGDYKHPTPEELKQQTDHWLKQRDIYQKKKISIKPKNLIAKEAYYIRGSLKYIGMEERHSNGIEGIVQCSRHKLFFDQNSQKHYFIQVFEVKFWGHEETDKLSYSEVIKENFIAVKKYLSAVKFNNQARFRQWRNEKNFQYNIYCSRSPHECLKPIEKMERAAYELYLKSKYL